MFKITLLGALIAASASSLVAQSTPLLPDPIPDPVPMGDLVLDLETFVTVPQSNNRNPRARISIMRALPDGRLFVCDLRGRLYRITQGQSSIYLNIRTHFSDFIDSPGLGTGLHSFAFHPEFAENGKFYTVHSEPWNAASADFTGPELGPRSSGHQAVVVEWTASNPAANTFSGLNREIMRVDFPGTIHGMQEIAFNPNAETGHPDYGMLYILIGEGGSYLQGGWNNQARLDSPMGTVFRIDPLGGNSANGKYGIPSENPWYDSSEPNVMREIYAKGFRNPHRISWDTAGNQHAYIGDIGERNIEEINLLESGLNYGFPHREGTFKLIPPDSPGPDSDEIYALPENDAEFGYTYPVIQYSHLPNSGNAIILAGVYRGSNLPELYGKMIFGDIVTGRMYYANADELQQGTVTQHRELRIRVNGVEGSLLAFVGANRADLRFGFDHEGELYVMSKIDGSIRKVTGAQMGDSSAIDSNPENWLVSEDFEMGLLGLSIVNNGGGDGVRIVNDPFGDPENRVLVLDQPGAMARNPLPQIADDKQASIFFRFAFEGMDSRFVVGPSDAISADNNRAIKAQVTGSGSGTLSLSARLTTEAVTDQLRPATWYDAWIIFNGSTNQYDFYIRGDNWTAPSLLSSGLSAWAGTSESLKSFLWTIPSSAEGIQAVYFDDLYFDETAVNLSSPLLDQWFQVGSFEQAEPVGWQFLERASGQTIDPDAEAFLLWEETSGNTYLSVKATESSQMTMAIAPLPFSYQVGQVFTIYGRMRADAPRINTVWGLSNLNPAAIPGQSFEAMEVIARVTDDMGSAQRLLIRDSNNFNPASGINRIEPDTWYEYWFVVRNGGQASGGQTFDMYWRGPDSDAEPEQIYFNATFRVAREDPIAHMVIIANNGTTGISGRVGFDDIYAISGEVLERPSGTGIGPFPGPRSDKVSPWFGWFSDQQRPWMYHHRLGWLKQAHTNDQGIWFYQASKGWFWTSPEVYPWHFKHESNSWSL